ncbi:hypothetical protein BpHYR1_011227 [Brachionus plicatilis]|uniref:Uncharacterized protein n=1 Tax=Brachionus plicatilis TaxID=10195 RepID=A0A3M7SNL8_BRAPC|nr:hypothetical protein BpHYR1_011227 [Brachionus plicatilis]
MKKVFLRNLKKKIKLLVVKLVVRFLFTLFTYAIVISFLGNNSYDILEKETRVLNLLKLSIIIISSREDIGKLIKLNRTISNECDKNKYCYEISNFLFEENLFLLTLKTSIFISRI